MNQADPFNLSRFLEAQERFYDAALAEIRNGQKRTHWMWFVFPQIDGLGFSSTTRYYAIKSLEEARQYLNHPLLGKRLAECAQALLEVQGQSISTIFDYPDDLKVKSCMTLFASTSEQPEVFVRVLEKYFNGERDTRTLQILEDLKQS